MLDVCHLVETIGIRHPDHSLSSDTPVASTTADEFRITAELIHRHGGATFILHPGPRTDEIDTDVDSLPNAKYFEQARNGLFVRMALMASVQAD